MGKTRPLRSTAVAPVSQLSATMKIMAEQEPKIRGSDIQLQGFTDIGKISQSTARIAVKAVKHRV
jgi:hypothetical protein